MRLALLIVFALASRAPSPAACVAGSKIENGACDQNVDCLMTDLPNACDACNLDKAYPALRRAFDRRAARCAATAACTNGCPPHDTDMPAFYRAECRHHRCVAWRSHGGG